MNKYIETLAEKLEDYKSESGPIIADGFDDAFIGMGWQCGNEPCVVYDRNKCIEILVEQGMEYDDAVEHFEFNVAGAYVGKQTPIFLERL